jgi:hypothetical protein
MVMGSAEAVLMKEVGKGLGEQPSLWHKILALRY